MATSSCASMLECSTPARLSTACSTPSAIAEFADEHAADLVVMSTHGRTGMERFFLGSVAEKEIRHVRGPVLTVKALETSLVSREVEERA